MRPFLAGLLLVLAVAAGCGKNGPPPLTLDEAPAAMAKAFASARSQVKQSSQSIARQIEQKQYVAAQIQLQALLANPDLTTEQRDVLSSAMLAINQTLQAQAASLQPAQPQEPGDPSPKPPAQAVSTEEAAAAAVAIENYRATK